MKHSSPVLKRIEDDEATRLRLRYELWYRTPERQEGAHVWVDGREMILMSSNDYLGLSGHPAVVEAARRASVEWGSSTTGARLANGSRAYHTRLEEQLAAFLGKEACHISAAGYLSCMSAPATFAGRGDLILVDRNVHSSLWSGISLSGARHERFAHNDAADLADVLRQEPREVPKLLVIEGVYSMEGHIAALDALLPVAREHGVFSIMDDAHGLGVLGEGGRGTASHFKVTDSLDVICGSLSKSLSSTGGFVAGSREVVEYLRTHSKQTIFSAAISPSQAAAAGAALSLLQTEPGHRERLWENTRYFRAILDDLGLDYWNSQTPAIPIVIGDRERAYRAWKKLWDEGVFTVLAISPGVPPGKDLIRTAVSARHSREDLDQVGEALKKALGGRR